MREDIRCGACHQAAIAWLERSSLSADLKAETMAFVSSCRPGWEGTTFCPACKSVLGGV